MMQCITLKNGSSEVYHARLSDEERVCAVAISIASSPGFNDIWGMIQQFTPSRIYEILSQKGPVRTQQYLCTDYSINSLEAAKKIMDRSEAASVRVLTYWDHAYPRLLREIQRPPLVLYQVGGIFGDRAVAVVGTRNSDARASIHARRIAGDLAAFGFTIVSGMAVGIDREAHLGALDAGGSTVGILANGIDVVYPYANRDLYERIRSSAGSALISEYPPGIRAGRWTFVRRNRVISGLCAGTVVVKAGLRSGALITARHATDQNREVFACVGNSFDEEYGGCHELIRSGAQLVSRSEDIINELSSLKVFSDASWMVPGGPLRVDSHNKTTAAGEQHESCDLHDRILLFLSESECNLDSIIRHVKATPSEVNEAIMSLEISGRIIRNGNTISRM